MAQSKRPRTAAAEQRAKRVDCDIDAFRAALKEAFALPSDPHKLRPGEILHFLNSSSRGKVLDDRRLRLDRQEAGQRVGDSKTVDLLKYLAWIRWKREEARAKPAAEGEPAGDGYRDHRERQAAKDKERSQSARDIWPIPEVKHPAEKEAASRAFRFFCERYFPRTFSMAWSKDHLTVIDRIQACVLDGGLFAMAMPRGNGKALALDTPLPAPRGWTTMGEVQVGDELFDENGVPCRVRFVTPVQTGRPCYEVAFSDGERIVCDADHLWTVHDRYSRQNPITLPTKTMVGRVLLPDSRDRVAHRYRLPMTAPLQLPKNDLPIAPYALGVWLGDGTCRNGNVTINLDDVAEIERYVQESGESLTWRAVNAADGHCRTGLMTKTGSPHTSFQGRLVRMGLLNNKHIPDAYLRGSYSQRMALLQGLMDTDGFADESGQCELVIKYPRLADGACELLTTLGIKHGRGEKFVDLDGKTHGPYARIIFVVHEDRSVFRLERKRRRLRPIPPTRPLCTGRHIVSIEPVESVPVRCIQVDSPSSLYLAGRRMVPTHNTSLCEAACTWALLYGHREFVAIIGPDEDHARDRVKNLKTELEHNDLLHDDFPEVCYPIRCLDGINQRRLLCEGQRVLMEFTANRIILPNIPGSRAAGAIVSTAGITGQIRGLNLKRTDGVTLRPSFALIDDPQTEESAWSPSQCAQREKIINGAILGLAGPDRKIAAIMPCTVVREDDLSDRLLDRKRNPEWQGERTKMVYAFPTNEKLWAKYDELRRKDHDAGDSKLTTATAFYAKHRKAMDAGAVVAWPERHQPEELSALQHAMNLRLRSESAFFAEYQNEPLPEVSAEDALPSPVELAGRLNGHARAEIPIGATTLTMFVDVQEKCLFWLVAAWEDRFTGYIVDYGTDPGQKAAYFSLREVRNTLAMAAPKAGFEGALRAGLERLISGSADRPGLLAREWKRDDGATMKIDRCLIDANWGRSTEVVYEFCRQTPFAGSVMPSHGRYVGASNAPFGEYKKKPGERVGLNWRVPVMTGRRAVRHVLFDTNYWKSFVFSRLTTAMGDPGAVSFFGHKPETHRMLVDHLLAEYRVKTEGRGRSVEEWKLTPGKDNHWLDGLVGAAVAASMQGVGLEATGRSGVPAKRKVLVLSELQAQRRRGL